MLPLKLTIQGLYAFPEQPQVIDFERLTQAQLFGIFGATGSGKSSILEAISFALYGETDRLKKSDRRNYNMLNLRANRLWIDYEFLGGQEDSKHYRFTAEIKRKSRNFDETFSPKREAFVKKDGEWFAIETGRITEILGLSYDNFKRTVIIPQGKFQEFLSLGNAERTRMLREIFHLERFELYDRVKKLSQKNETAITREDTLLTQLATATSDALEAKEITLQTLQKTQEAARLQLTDIEKNINRFDAQKELLVQLEMKRSDLQNREAERTNIEEKKQHIARYESAKMAFAPLAQRQQELSTELTETKKSLDDIAKDRNETSEALTLARKTHERVKQAFDMREDLKTQAEDFARLARTRPVIAEITNLEERINTGDTQIAEARQQSEDATAKEQTLEQQYRTLRAETPDLDTILKAREWLDTYSRLQDTDKRLKAEKLQTEDAHKRLFQKLGPALAVLNIDAQSVPDAWKLEAENAVASKAHALKEAEEIHHQHALASHIAQLSTSLKEDEPCPVCGSLEHDITNNAPLPAPPELESLRKALKEATAAQVSVETLGPEITIAQSKLIQSQKASDEQQALLGKHVATAPMEPKAMEAKIHAGTANQQQIKETETALEKLKEIRKEADASLKRLHDHKQTLSQALSNLNAKLEAEQAGLRMIQAADYERHTATQLEDLRVDALSKYDSVGELYKKESQRLDELVAKENKLEGAWQQIHDQFQALNRKEATLILEIQQTLDGSSFDSFDAAKAVLAKAPNIAEDKLAIESWNQAYAEAKAAYEQAEAQTSSLEYDADAHQKIKEEADDIRQQIESKLIEIGSLQQNIARLKAQLEEKKAIQKRMKALQQRADNLKLLRKLFTGSGFVNYVSGIYLRQLCQAANERFLKLTHNQLQLEPTDDNSFAVRDFLNDGQLRSHKTLSGGQVFQASLCLALALADQVQDRARSKQRFFFIDEGFGALDKQSLNLVFEALRQLRKEKRIVGVISHVEDMQEDIDTYLRITNDGEHGSQVSTSW